MNRYLVKIAEAMRPHQEESLKKLDSSDGVILHHSTGSGKTRTFLEALARQQKSNPSGRALLVAPASLVSNVDKEVKKHGVKVDLSKVDVLSYEKATRRYDDLKKHHYALAIADEAHKLRNTETERSKKLGELIAAADKRVLATATANYNHVADIAPLVNIAAGEKVMPTDRKEFENRYIDHIVKNPSFFGKLMGEKPQEYDTLRNKGELKKVFGNYLHHYDNTEDPESQKDFPTKTERVVQVEMSPEQHRMYKFVEADLPVLLQMKIRNNLPLSKKEMANLNAFATGVRQVSTGYRYLNRDKVGDFTPKVKTAVESLEKKHGSDKNFRGLVYSNFLESGVDEYSRLLSKKGIKHAKFTGGLTQKEKDALVSDYNSGKTPVLLVSSSGSEGLDLKGTKLIQTLDPHFNPSKIRQIVGRGVRYKSHEHLPPEERHVEVEHYLSALPKPLLAKTAPTSIDQYLHQRSGEKQDVFDQVKDLMKEST